VGAPSEEKSDDKKDSIYEELQLVLDHLPRYHITILLGVFNAKVERENIFKPTIGSDSLHQDSNDNVVRIVTFSTSKYPVIKNTIFPHRDIQKFTWTSPDGKTRRQINHILTDTR
jgi:hypothetical protein